MRARLQTHRHAGAPTHYACAHAFACVRATRALARVSRSSPALESGRLGLLTVLKLVLAVVIALVIAMMIINGGFQPFPSDGRGDRIRTCDPLLPKQMRYQAAPLPAFAEGFGGQARRFCPNGLPAVAPQGAKDGGPGRIRTYNLAVMSGRLYR